MIPRAGQRINMKWSAWLQSQTCQNAHLTAYDFQSKSENGHGMINMIAVTNMPACITHQLWLPKEVKEWIWYDQHDPSNQYARIHNSPTVMARITPNMNISWSAWSWSSTCHNAQLTHYNCQSRTKNEHRIISMITGTNMPECTTHCLWFPEQNKESTWNDQQDYSHQHATMHNSLAMISRAGQRMDKKWLAWLQSPTCQHAQLTTYDCQSRVKNDD